MKYGSASLIYFIFLNMPVIDMKLVIQATNTAR